MSYRAKANEGGSARVTGLLALGLSVMFFCSCGSKPVEEIVTTDASRSSVVPPGAQPIAREPDLPARDADIEIAGDRIAEARTYLNSRRRDRREAALRALNQAEAAVNRAYHARPHDDDAGRASLRAVLRDLDTAERAVQRSASDAPHQLAALDRTLDNLNLQPATAEPDPSPSPSPSPS